MTPQSIRSRLARGLMIVPLVLSTYLLASGLSPASAATNGGSLEVRAAATSPNAGQLLSGGGTAEQFTLVNPTFAACSGDSANDGYRIQSYVVPAAINPETLTFDSNGPIPAGTGAALRVPLFNSVNGVPFVDRNTAVETGQIVGVPAFSFAVFGAEGGTIVPAGTYNVGLACTLGSASATQLDKYWNVQINVTTAAADPGGFTWTVLGQDPTTTTTSTSTGSSTTSTSTGSSTTSTGSSTTSSSTSSTGSSTTTSTVAVRGVTQTPGSGGTSGSLPATGMRPITVWLVFGASLLLIVGRSAILAGREINVVPPDRR